MSNLKAFVFEVSILWHPKQQLRIPAAVAHLETEGIIS